MPAEGGRKVGRKRIPIGSKYVDVPVIQEISFIDPREYYQEYRYTINNSAQSARQVHVVAVKNDTDTDSIQVERIDKWPVFDLVSRAQDTIWAPDNVTGETETPPHFSTHLKTHVYRYEHPSDDTYWIESELIDSFIFIGENGQETLFTLQNVDAQADDSMEQIADTANGVDPPWRTDPFQNIIRWSTGGVEGFSVFMGFWFNDSAYDSLGYDDLPALPFGTAATNLKLNHINCIGYISFLHAGDILSGFPASDSTPFIQQTVSDDTIVYDGIYGLGTKVDVLTGTSFKVNWHIGPNFNGSYYTQAGGYGLKLGAFTPDLNVNVDNTFNVSGWTIVRDGVTYNAVSATPTGYQGQWSNISDHITGMWIGMEQA